MFPNAVTVRFHLGLMLIWIGQVQEAKVQLQRVVAAGPSPFLAGVYNWAWFVGVGVSGVTYLVGMKLVLPENARAAVAYAEK